MYMYMLKSIIHVDIAGHVVLMLWNKQVNKVDKAFTNKGDD